MVGTTEGYSNRGRSTRGGVTHVSSKTDVVRITEYYSDNTPTPITEPASQLVPVLLRFADRRFVGKTLEELQRLNEQLDALPVDHTPEPDVTIRSTQRRLGSARVEVLVQRYQQGETVRELARQFDINRDSVVRLLTEAGIDAHRQPLSAETLERARTLYEAGSSLSTAAKEVGIPRETLRRKLAAMGVAFRPRN